MAEETKRKVYKTSSIVLAATLVHEKMELIGLEPIMKKGHDLYNFVFRDEEVRRTDLVMKFSNNDLKVVPSTFMEIVRQLKQRTKEHAANYIQ